jgi:hypothetical protein
MTSINRFPWIVLVLFLAAIACSTVTPATSATQKQAAATDTPAVLPAESPTVSTGDTTPTVGAETPSAIPPGRRYSVVLIPPGAMLEAHAVAGADSPVVGTIPQDSTGLVPTGMTSTIGPDTWSEVQLPAGGTGWMNRKNLTEDVDSTGFCADPRPLVLFTSLLEALRNNDGRLLTPLVSPVHGLTVLYIHNGNPKVYDAEEASFVFGRFDVIDWGLGPGSGLPVEGSFAELVRPDLLTVLDNSHESNCDTISFGGASYPVVWPSEWKNFHFYSLYKPGSADQELDWMTWVAGVEYVDATPYLTSLTRYTWEP